MAGTIGLSLTQRYDKTSHEPLDGGLLYFYAAGTTTPQNAYQDVDLTIPWPNPITLDSGGNVPQLFFADGYIKFRLTNSAGVSQIEADYVLVVGPSSGGGGAPSVDATTILATGDIKIRYGTGALTGFVRANARTIGNVASGASERANADTEALFVYLWGADANLTVSTGRGASAAADYAAGKTIALPDFRGRVPAGLDDMGNTSAARLTVMASTTLGIAGGNQEVALTTAQLPAHTHANTLNDPGHVHTIPLFNGLTAGASTANAATGSTQSSGSSTTGITITNASVGSGSAHLNVQPTILMTYYMKL
jgi:microcystin-dependent protein